MNSAPGFQIVERGVQMLGSEINRTLKQATKQNATCTWYDDKLNFNMREDSLGGFGNRAPDCYFMVNVLDLPFASPITTYR